MVKNWSRDTPSPGDNEPLILHRVACLQLGGDSIRQIGLMPELGLNLSSSPSHLRTPWCMRVVVDGCAGGCIDSIVVSAIFLAPCSLAYCRILRNAAIGLVPKSEPTRSVGDLILPKSHHHFIFGPNPTPCSFRCSLLLDFHPNLILSREHDPEHHVSQNC